MALIKDILAAGDAYKQLTSQKYKKQVSLDDVNKALDPSKHAVFDEAKRPKKTIDKPTGKKDDNGELITQETKVDVNRLPVSFQELILSRAVAFLYGNDIKLKYFGKSDADKALFDLVEATLSDNKMHFRRKERARKVLSECEAATLWFFVDNPTATGDEPKLKLKCRLLCESNGDTLYPHYDEFGDMDAFSREYVITEGDKKVTYFDVYTAESTYFYKVDSGNLVQRAPAAKNIFGKIPVIYYKWDKPVWYIVQKLIERYEERLSNTADTNDYDGDPMLLLKGDTPTWFDKGERGKVVVTDSDGDGKYITHDQMSGSVEFELKTLKELIYTLSQTPDISFENLKSLGSDISGIALKFMFMDAHMAAENRWEVFGEMEQRELNLLKTMIGKAQMIKYAGNVNTCIIEPLMTPYLPKNEKEIIQNLLSANGGKPIICQESSVDESPFGYDATEQMEKLNAEANAEANRASTIMTGSMQ